MYIFRKNDLVTFNHREVKRTDPGRIMVLLREVPWDEAQAEYPEEPGHVWEVQTLDGISCVSRIPERYFEFLQRREMIDEPNIHYPIYLQQVGQIDTDRALLDEDALAAAKSLMDQHPGEGDRTRLVARLLQLAYK